MNINEQFDFKHNLDFTLPYDKCERKFKAVPQ